MKTVQALGDGDMVQVVQEFDSADSYAEYNDQDLFYGTRVEALAQGNPVNKELVNAADGTPADPDKLEKALEEGTSDHHECQCIHLLSIPRTVYQ